MRRYPAAEWVPWAYNPASPSYWAGANRPSAVVLHVMEGYESTVRQWAASGYAGASWHFTVCRDGRVLQHLEFEDGGYHAGVPDWLAAQNPPRWSLWRGLGINVNWYTLGIEHEGFAGEPFTPQQAEASRALCRWLAQELAIPFDRWHFPAHAEINVRDRPTDFNTAPLRDDFYRFLFEVDEEGDMLKYRELDQAETIQVFEAVTARHLGGAINDDGGSVVEVTEGLPPDLARRVPPGGRAVLYITAA